MAKLVRVALIGGSTAIRKARRDALEFNQNFQVVFDSDGFGLTEQGLLDLNFDVAIIEQRLPNLNAFAFINAVHALAKVTDSAIGRFLVSTTFADMKLRIEAITFGAVDCISVEQGLGQLIEVASKAAEVDADFGIREILAEIQPGEISDQEYSRIASALDTLDLKEANILKAFCELKSDTQIAQVVQVPKLKVRNTVTKVTNLLQLNTRSQLLLKLRQLDALTF